MNWITIVLKKYATFSGRAQRAEYWYFVLFYLVGYFALIMLDSALGLWSKEAEAGVLSSIFALGVLLPFIAVATRRLHDIGKSGWWQLIGFIPLLGGIVLIVFFARKGDAGSNEYGPSPLAPDKASAVGFG
jgi:uncharacterized membrane protein YhaH (DUF805 family)